MKHPDPPSKPSELIRLALRDLKAVERSKNYAVQMGMWHCPTESTGVCEVCLAGAVMAKSLKVKRELDVVPGELTRLFGVSPGWHNPLVALDELRLGNLSNAAHCWHACGALTGIRFIPPYWDGNKKAFHLAMEALAA